MATLNVPEREYGAVKKSEDELADVPIPRQAPPTSQAQAQPQQAPPTETGTDYARDILATSPLAALPVDIQKKLYKAKMWFEIAAHPGATEFEQALANAHFDELEGPKEKDQDTDSKKKKPDKKESKDK